MEGGGVIYNFECGETKDHFSTSFWTEYLNVKFFLLKICIVLVTAATLHGRTIPVKIGLILFSGIRDLNGICYRVSKYA